MSIALVVTQGYGNGTLTGTVKDVVTRGYGIGDPPAAINPPLSADIELVTELSANIELKVE